MEGFGMVTPQQLRVETMRNRRLELLRKYNDSYDPEADIYTMEEPKEINELGEKIYDMLCKHQGLFTVDFIIEELTHLGDAPSILYDDNGNFAVCSDGTQNTVFEPSDMTISHFVEKDMWKPTIREALEYYLKTE